MKNQLKLIIFSVFFSNIPKLSSSISCNPISCPRGVNTSKYTVDVSIRNPFHIEDLQPKSCGMPGFELYCNKTLGPLIQLPNDVVLRVDSIYYYNRHMVLSDPYDCLPRKLMALDLSRTPFYPHEITKKFWVYNCSGNYTKYDRIDCLSGLDYTVISSGYDNIKSGDSLKCTFVKILTVPVSYSSIDLSGISRIELAWKGTLPPGGGANYSILTTVGLILGLTGIMAGVIMFGYRVYRRRNQQTTSTTNTINRTPVIGGLDQVAIDSYPVVVIGESGSLIKPDDDICPICLSDYQLHDALKILPECLHRFHADCIDQWLRSKGLCPICRISLPS